MDVQTKTIADGYISRRPYPKCNVVMENYKSALKFCRSCCFALAALIIVLALSAGHAWSLETADPETHSLAKGESVSLSENTPPPSLSGTCRAFLENIKTYGSVSDRDQGRQPQAGTAAALGLVFGVRFALTPPKRRGAKQALRREMRLDFWHPRSSAPNAAGSTYDGLHHALTIAAFRQCQKQQALHALDDFRWSR